MAVGLVLLAATQAPAQDVYATSFDQLRMLTRLGDTITVTDASGASTTGKLVSLSPSTLTVLSGRTRRDLAEPDVRRITGRTHASLVNGARAGFGIGAGLGLLAGLSLANACSDGCAPLLTAVVLTYGGLGAGVGVGVAAMITRHPTLYEARNPADAGRSVGRSPGIGLTLRF